MQPSIFGGKTLRWDCPSCDRQKSKKATTCMSCFRNGRGLKRKYTKSVRYDKDLPDRIRKAVEKLKTIEKQEQDRRKAKQQRMEKKQE